MSDDSDSSEYDSDSDELNTIGDGVRFRVFFFFEFLSDFVSGGGTADHLTGSLLTN